MTIKLCLGSGERNLGRDWIHVDGSNNDTTHKHCKHSIITDLSQFEDNSVDVLYASHVLEYFDQIEVIDVLREWYRVLKKGGIIRLSVPDFEVLASLYCQKENIVDMSIALTGKRIVVQNRDKMKIRNLIGPLFGRMEMDGEMIYHKTTYDFETLTQLLYHIGFKRVNRYDCERVKPHNKVDDQSHAYFPHMDKNGTLVSLNVEGVK